MHRFINDPYFYVWDIEGLQNMFLATQHPRRRSQPGKDHRDLIMDFSWKYHEIPWDLASHMEWYGMIWMWKTNTFSKTNLFVILRLDINIPKDVDTMEVDQLPGDSCFHFHGSYETLRWHLCAHQFIHDLASLAWQAGNSRARLRNSHVDSYQVLSGNL